MINPSRLATAAVLCELGIVVWLAGSGSSEIQKSEIQKAEQPALGRLAPLLAADIAPVTPPRLATPRNPVVASVDIVKAAELLAKQAAGEAKPLGQEPAADIATSSLAPPAAADAPVAKDATAEAAPAPSEQKPIVVATLTEPSEVLTPATPPVAAATAPPPEAPPQPQDARDAAMNSVEIFDECFVANACIDRYLFALYLRTPKEDSVKETEKRQVSVKRKGKTITVTRSITTVVDENFAWKDPKAADKAGMSMMDYVIGGMDGNFKLKLFNLMRAAEKAGMSPGITSAFRDDYRQSIASGLKAASDRSYHGGSTRGGYGHGLAADVVSVNGATRAQRQASSEAFWRWIDVHGKDYGMGRPYLDRDPPHVGAIDGEEYVKHRGTATVRARDGGGKRSKMARS
jgi:hypothetical protein